MTGSNPDRSSPLQAQACLYKQFKAREGEKRMHRGPYEFKQPKPLYERIERIKKIGWILIWIFILLFGVLHPILTVLDRNPLN